MVTWGVSLAQIIVCHVIDDIGLNNLLLASTLLSRYGLVVEKHVGSAKYTRTILKFLTFTCMQSHFHMVTVQLPDMARSKIIISNGSSMFVKDKLFGVSSAPFREENVSPRNSID